MTIATQQTLVHVAPTDADGYTVGPDVPVWIEYAISVDHLYGEDADGHQGVTRVEYDILDAFIEADDLQRLTAAQAEHVLADARAIFAQRQKHF